MNYLVLKLLPKNLFSKVMGKLAEARLPSPLLQSFLKLYCTYYAVNLQEMANTSLKQFNTFNEFFTRQLDPQKRPIDDDPESVISPVDGKIAEFGEIKNGLLLQTKGVLYSISDLVGKKMARIFKDGYFITLYLSPSDYHRIHTPVSGTINDFSYFSGNLWPVNDLGVSLIGGLFSLNERIVTSIKSECGTVAVVKVGATVVGKIKLNYSDLSSNKGEKNQLHLPVFPIKSYQKGDEIGRFQLGSTVILLFEKDRFKPLQLLQDQSIKMGQALGHF